KFCAPSDFSPDGRSLLVQVATDSSNTKHAIWAVPVEGDAKPRALLASDADYFGPGFSSDGKWISYVSTESGRPEIYVAPYPGPGDKWQISTDGTGGGGFSGRGLELVYGDVKTGQAMSAQLRANGGGLEVGEPKALFPLVTFSAVTVDRHGGRFLLATLP